MLVSQQVTIGACYAFGVWSYSRFIFNFCYIKIQSCQCRVNCQNVMKKEKYEFKDSELTSTNFNGIVVTENYTKTFHEIISGLGTILSSLNANSGIMAIFMSWGDTQNSEDTLIMLNDYIDRYIKK